MNNLLESRLNMYSRVDDYNASRSSITDALPNYTYNYTILKSKILEIKALAEQQKQSIKGVTEYKNILKENLIVITADNARKLNAYARFTNNVNLAQKTKLREGKLRTTSDAGVKDYAQMIYNLAKPIIESLDNYGITLETQTELLNMISTYNETIGSPRASLTESMQITKQLEYLFKTADLALENMDAAVEIIRLSQPLFYKGYKDARKVILTGIRKISVKGMITNAMNGTPIKGATLTFTKAANGEAPKSSTAKPTTDGIFVKMSAEKGGFNIKTLPSGMYDVTISKVGYADRIETIAVADGELTELYIQLSKN